MEQQQKKSVGENIHKAILIMEKTYASLDKLKDKLCSEAVIESTSYKAITGKFMSYNENKWHNKYCFLAFQKKDVGEPLGDKLLKAPIYIVGINLFDYEFPKIVLAKFDFGKMERWDAHNDWAWNFELFYDPIVKRDRFKVVKERKCSKTHYNICTVEYADSVSQNEIERLEKMYYGFKKADIVIKDLLDIDGQNYIEEIFGTMDEL